MIWTERLWHFHDILWACSQTTSLLFCPLPLFCPSPQVFLTTLFVFRWLSSAVLSSSFLLPYHSHSSIQELLSHAEQMQRHQPPAFLLAGTWTDCLTYWQETVPAAKFPLTQHFCINWMCNDFYPGCVRGCDDPGAVGIVVILDRVVWRRDHATRSSQLTAAHWCCKGRHKRKGSGPGSFNTLSVNKAQRTHQHLLWIRCYISKSQC